MHLWCAPDDESLYPTWKKKSELYLLKQREEAFSSWQSELTSAILQKTDVTTGQSLCESKPTVGYINQWVIVTIVVICTPTEKMALWVNDHITLTEISQAKED